MRTINAIKITEEILKAVKEADEENADYYSDNAESFIDELTRLDGDFAEATATSEKSFIVVGDRFPLRYLTERYNIDYYSAFPGCSAQTEANPVTIAELIERVEEYGVSTVFKVDLGTGKVADSICESTGAVVRTLYSCHTVSAEDFEKGEGYISLMRRNLEVIAEALK